MEEWRDIPEYEGYYQANDKGEIRNCNRGSSMTSHIHRTGYYQVTLTKDKVRKNWKLHRIVALTFIPNPENKPCVNHKNGDKSDNTISNLEWCTYKENNDHAVSNSLWVARRGEEVGKLTEEEVLDIREKYATGDYTQKSLGEEYGIHQGHITKIVNLKSWTHI